MYVALVVDDEEIIRRGICRKLERFFPELKLAPPQENALEALHYIQGSQVDIVYVDIRMPLVDGLEFISRARQYNPYLQFVVISGYTNFEYAKSALQLKVKDYLLKPIDNGEFKEVTARLIQELDQKERQIRDRSIVKGQAEEGKFFKKCRYLTELVRVDSSMDTVELMKDLEEMGIRFPNPHYRVVAVLIQDIRSVPEFEDVSGLSILQFAVCNIIDEVFLHCGCTSFVHEKGENQFIIILNTETPLAIHFLREKAVHLVNVLKNIYGMEASAGIGREVLRTEDLCVSYTGALECSLQCSMLGLSRVDICEGQKDKKLNLRLLNEFDKNILEGYIKSQNEAGIRQFVEDMLRKAKEDGLSYTNVKVMCLDIYMLAAKLLMEKGKDTETAVRMLEKLERQSVENTGLEEFRKYLEQTLQEISRQFDDRKKSGGKTLIADILTYVEEHYSKDVSLGTIAGKFYINPSYLSQLFKKEMNMKFIDYITDVRIKKALVLLETTSLTVNEVAEAVGYKDTRYFREIFVKHMGQTPSQYRSRKLAD